MARTPALLGVADPVRYVRSLAFQIIALHPSCIDVDDIAGQGLLALVQALHRFDAQRGVRFSTYAWSRVRFAMVDHVRTEVRRRRFLRFEDGIEVPDERSPEDLVLQRDLTDHVHREIEKMPVRRRMYLQSVLEGCTDKAACLRATVSRGTAAEMRKKAIRDLRSMLEVEPEATLRAAA